jgi:antagonist of KipI
MKPVFEVLRAGPAASIQDLGRPAAQALGFGPSGAMDPFALRAANLLAGNPRDAAAIESGLGGLVLRALEERVVAVTGAGSDWRSRRVRAGEEIALPAAVEGVWSYVAVDGGFAADLFLGSAATDARARRGGHGGRRLAAGDVLSAHDPRGGRDGRGLSRSAWPAYPPSSVVRVVMGPRDDLFTDEGLRLFLSETYEVSGRSDRMGYHLNGPAIPFRGEADVPSEAVAFGSIQVPADGRPIVLMAEHQATGGYAQVATLIGVDVAKVAQTRPGGKLRFRAVSVEEAQDAAVRMEQLMSTLEAGVKGTGKSP